MVSPQKKPIIDEVATVEAGFNELMRKVDLFDAGPRAVVATGTAFSWRVFVAHYSSAEGFQNAPEAKQAEIMDHLEKIKIDFKRTEGEVSLAAIGVELTRMYLFVLMERNAVVGNRMADRLERLNYEGFQLLK